jgi:hypothetical protein
MLNNFGVDMLKKICYFYAIFIFSVFCLISCNNNNSTNTQLPAKSLKASISGSEISTFDALTVTGNVTSGVISIIGISLSNKMTLSFSESSTGTVSMGATGNIGTYSTLTSTTEAYISATGTIKITQNDTKTVAGTFSFTGINSSDITKSITVTNGNFSWNK